MVLTITVASIYVDERGRSKSLDLKYWRSIANLMKTKRKQEVLRSTGLNQT
ncbi:hypothetical protein HMPREF9621_01647 [Cutibacterium modestum HL037PA2]|nr:hypothetical protein HMPREF9621_01647 [Cutibacterium modestum HL037PA2]